MRKAATALILLLLAGPIAYRLSWREAMEIPPGKTAITYMAWGYPSQLKTEGDLVEAFHRENPDVHVTFIMAPMSSYYDKVTIMFASGTAPDILRTNPQHFAAYARLGYLMHLDPLMDADPLYDPADYFPAARDAGLYDGKHFALGVLFTRSLVYYNKTLFREAGVEEPWDAFVKGQWTWDNMLEKARLLTKYDDKGRPIQFGMNFPGRSYGLFEVAAANGGKILSDDLRKSLVNTPKVVEAAEWILDLKRKWRVAPTPEQGALSIFSFESGRLAMEIDSSGESPRLRDAIKNFEWDVAPTPYGTEGPGATHGAHLLVMNAAAKQADAAWRFMKFVTGPVAERLLGVELRRCIPTRRDLAMSEEYLSADEPPFNMRAFVADIERRQPNVPVTEKWNEWTTELETALEQIWLESKSPQEALDEAAERIDVILNEPL